MLNGGGPTKGILKKTNSNPHLARLDSLNVVDIRKYLRDRDAKEEQLMMMNVEDDDDDNIETRTPSPTKSLASERSFASEMTTATEPAAGQRMYRALSGQSLPDMVVYQARANQQKQARRHKTI